MSTLEQRRKELSAKIAAFGAVPKKKEKKAFTHSSFQYKTLGSRPIPWLPKQKEVKKKTPVRSPFTYESLKIKDGETPVKGKDYFTPKEIEQVKNEILDTVKSEMPTPEKPEVVIDEEMVKKIIQIMHALPETDKLEVSKGIRNAQSNIFGRRKTK